MSTFTVPNNLVDGTTNDAVPVMGNFNALATAGNAVDHTNLAGGTGIYASQVIPTNGTQATFGGSTSYTFPASILATVSGAVGYVPVVLGATGAITAATQKIIFGTTYMGNTLTANSMTTVAQNLTGAAVFSNVASYQVFVSLSAFSGTPLGTVMYASPTSISAFNVIVYAGSNTLTFVTVNWMAIGT